MPVVLDGLDVLGDAGEVLEHVARHLLDADGLGPGSDLVKIALKILALSEVSRELLDEGDDLLDGVNNGVNVESREVGDDGLNLGLEALTVSEALLDLGEVVVLDEAVEDAGDELLSLLEVDSEGESHGGNERVLVLHI